MDADIDPGVGKADIYAIWFSSLRGRPTQPSSSSKKQQQHQSSLPRGIRHHTLLNDGGTRPQPAAAGACGTHPHAPTRHPIITCASSDIGVEASTRSPDAGAATLRGPQFKGNNCFELKLDPSGIVQVGVGQNGVD